MASFMESHNNFMNNSFCMVMSDDGYDGLRSNTLTIYLPSFEGDAISRNEFDMYVGIGLVNRIIRPYNSIRLSFNQTNMANILSSIHVQVPDMDLLFHPSLQPYIDVI